MEPTEALYVGGPLAAFAVSVFCLLYFWPRPPPVLLDRQRKKVQILDIVEVSPDTKRFRLSCGDKKTILGLPIGKHILIFAPNPPSAVLTGEWNGRPDSSKGKQEIDRTYTPITGNETPGYVDLVIKIYRPGTARMPDGLEVKWVDGGKMGLYLDSRKPGDYIDINGPIGVNEYLGRGMFKLPGRTLTVKHVCMIAGGTGLTPMLQIVNAALLDANDRCRFTLLYANKTEDDILCKEMLEDAEERSKGRFNIIYTLNFPPDGWKQKTGFITTGMIQECFPPPKLEPLFLLCGPPPMVEIACKPNLEALGYSKQAIISF